MPEPRPGAESRRQLPREPGHLVQALAWLRRGAALVSPTWGCWCRAEGSIGPGTRLLAQPSSAGTFTTALVPSLAGDLLMHPHRNGNAVNTLCRLQPRQLTPRLLSVPCPAMGRPDPQNSAGQVVASCPLPATQMMLLQKVSPHCFPYPHLALGHHSAPAHHITPPTAVPYGRPQHAAPTSQPQPHSTPTSSLHHPC